MLCLHFLAFLFPVAPMVPPTTVVPLSLSEIGKAAELIAAGTVAASECRYVDGKRTIKTFVTLRDLTVWRGAAAGELVLQLEGGQIGDDRLQVPGMPELLPGKRYLVFVAQNGKQPSPIVGFWQGLFEVTTVNRKEVLLDVGGLQLLDVREDRFVKLTRASQAPEPARRGPDAVSTGPGQPRVVPALPMDGAPCQLVATARDASPILVPREQDPGTRITCDELIRRLGQQR